MINRAHVELIVSMGELVIGQSKRGVALDGLLEQLREQARAGGETEKVVEAIARVFEARDLAQGNVNPQLRAAVLADELGGEPA